MSRSHHTSAEAERLSADDRFAIIELLARYSWALDTNQPAACASLFIKGGYADVSSGRYENIEELVRKVNNQDWCIGQQHWVGNHVFQGNNKQCRVKSMHFAPRRQGGEHVLVSVGVYVDDVVKVNGVWRFARRWWRPWEEEILAGAEPWANDTGGGQPGDGGDQDA